MNTWQHVRTAIAHRPPALGGKRISKQEEAAEMAKTEQLAAEAAPAEETERAAEETADQPAADRWEAAAEAASRRDGRDHTLELMYADPDGVDRACADLDRSIAQAEQEELPGEPDFWIGLQPGYNPVPMSAAELGLPLSTADEEADREAGG